MMHAPTDDLMFDYAAGSLPEPLALAVASHAVFHPNSASRIQSFEAIGGALLDKIPPVALSDGALERAMASLEESDVSESGLDTREAGALSDSAVPIPLRPYIGLDFEALKWRRVGKSVHSVALTTGGKTDRDYDVRLLRIQDGSPVPEHTHRGSEITVTLAGGYHDGKASYQLGDYQLADDTIQHQPHADRGEDCICLVVLDKPIRLTGPFGRLINPFVRL